MARQIGCCKGCGRDTTNIGLLCTDCRWSERTPAEEREPNARGWRNGVPIGPELDPVDYERSRDDDIADEILDSLDLD